MPARARAGSGMSIKPNRQSTLHAGVGQIDVLGVHDPELHVAQTPGLGPAPRCFHHGRAHVGRDQEPVRGHPGGGQEAGLAWPGGQLQHRLARLGVDVVEEPVRHSTLHLEEAVPVALPRGRQSVRPLSRLLAGIERRTSP